jgi:hypothetical protein
MMNIYQNARLQMKVSEFNIYMEMQVVKLCARIEVSRSFGMLGALSLGAMNQELCMVYIVSTSS